MTYTQDATRLARAVAALTAQPERWPALSESERPAALAARDAVVSELRDLTHLVLRRPAPGRADLSLITASPAQALRVALDALPMATGSDTALTDTLTVAGGPLVSAWQAAARAAVALEAYHAQIVAGLTDDDAWTLTRDLADLARAVPHLDADLAAALPPGDEQTRRLLLDPAGHGLIRLAATELQAQTADLAPAAAPLAAPTMPGRPGVVRNVAELPAATRHLSTLLTARGPALTAAESRAVARTLAAGADLTAQVIARTHPQQPDGPAAAAHLHAAAVHLQKVANAKVATLRPPTPAVLFLTQQISLQFTAARDRTDQLPRTPSSPPVDRITPPLLAWAGQAAATTASLADCLEAAAETGRLLAPRQDTGRGRTEHYLWLPTSLNSTAGDSVVSHARAAVDALAAAEQRIAAVTGELTIADRSRAATRSAAAAAATAFTELRAALAARTPPAAPRLRHPALPPAHQPTSRKRQ